jgi:uncharacterized protein YciW
MSESLDEFLMGCGQTALGSYATTKEFNDTVLRKLISLVDATLNDNAQNVFEDKEVALLGYVRNLALDPASLTAASIDALCEAGAHHGEILEVNQVAGYFAYSNRVVLGLGVTLDSEAHT